MKFPANAFLIGAGMALCLAGIGVGQQSYLSPDRLPGYFPTMSKDIPTLWKDLSSTLDRSAKVELKSGRFWENGLKKLPSRHASDMSNVWFDSTPDLRSGVWEKIDGWKLQGNLYERALTAISSLVETAIVDIHSHAYGFVYTPPIPPSSISSLSAAKSTLFFVIQKLPDHIEVGFIAVNTTAHKINSTSVSDGVIEDGLCNYHGKYVLGHIPQPTKDCVDGDIIPVVQTFKEIDRKHKNHHETHTKKRSSNGELVIGHLGDALDECFRLVQSNYSVEYWRACEGWDHDFSSKVTVFECEGSQSEATPSKNNKDCQDVLKRTTYTQAAVVPRQNGTLEVHVTVKNSQSSFVECAGSVSNTPVSSDSIVLHSNFLELTDGFEPTQYLSNWSSHNFPTHMRSLKSKLLAFPDDNKARLIASHTQTRFNSSRGLSRQEPQARVEPLAGDVRSEKNTVSPSVSDDLKQLAEGIRLFSDALAKFIETTKTDIQVSKTKVNCLRFDTVNYKVNVQRYEGLEKETVRLLTNELLVDLEVPKNRTVQFTAGMQSSRTYDWLGDAQVYRHTDGSQGYIILLLSKDPDNLRNLLVGHLKGQSGIASDEIWVTEDFNILGGLIRWHKESQESEDHLVSVSELQILNHFWTWLLYEGFAAATNLKPPAALDLTWMCLK